MDRRIVGNDVVEVLSGGHHIVLASVKRDGRAWKITMRGLTENGWPTYGFTKTRRAAIDRLRFIYRTEV